jgi:hypothetical protein
VDTPGKLCVEPVYYLVWRSISVRMSNDVTVFSMSFKGILNVYEWSGTIQERWFQNVGGYFI